MKRYVVAAQQREWERRQERGKSASAAAAGAGAAGAKRERATPSAAAAKRTRGGGGGGGGGDADEDEDEVEEEEQEQDLVRLDEDEDEDEPRRDDGGDDSALRERLPDENASRESLGLWRKKHEAENRAHRPRSIYRKVNYEAEDEPEKRTALDPRKERLMQHIKATYAVPADLETSRAYGPLSGLTYADRLVRAFETSLLRPKTALVGDWRRCWRCEKGGHLSWDCPSLVE